MSGIWTEKIVHLPDISSSSFDVWDKASFCCPYPENQISGKIDVRNKDSDVWNKNSDVRNTDNDVRDTESDVRKMDKIPVLIPDIDI